MKRIILSSLLLALLVGVTSLAPAKKYKFKSKEAKLSVTFPIEFTESEKDEGAYRTVQAQASTDEMVYFASYSVHTEDISESEELAEISLNAFIGGVGAEIKEKKTWNVKKFKGLRATFESAETNLVGDYRVVLIGQIQYQITAVSPKATWDEENAQKFFKSFKVKK